MLGRIRIRISMNIKVILADDHKMIRTCIRSMLNKYSDIEVIAETENGEETIQKARELQPDVIIMDLCMPDLNGIDATFQIVSKSLNIKVLALSMYSDEHFVMDIFKAGATGFITKDTDFEELVNAIRLVNSNHIYLCPGLSKVIAVDSIKKDLESIRLTRSVLSGREYEVLKLFAEGKTTKTIASELYVSAKTVETHRQHIMDKLGIHSLVELTKYAIREGLTNL